MQNYIRRYYSRLYEGERQVSKRLPIVRGRSLAAALGYPAALLDALPDEIWSDFLPCGNVLRLVRPGKGERVLNLGCGIGVDSLALRLAGPGEIQVVSLDTAHGALQKAMRLAERTCPESRMDYIRADGANLPFAASSFDWVMLNGVFNLFPEKSVLTREIGRVLKTGGTVAGADLCRRVAALPDYFASEPDAWAWCMSGALSEEELGAAFESFGFRRKELSLEEVDELFGRVLFAFEKTA